MPTKKSSVQTVDEFLAVLEHPLKPVVLALRALILGVDPQVTEGIKWNAPSFRTTEYFATFHLRSAENVRIVLHVGAKVRDTAITGIAVADPTRLLTWQAKDRATVTFRDLAEVSARQAAFEQLIREWIQHV